MPSTIAFRISAIFGFLAVALGAFGAHGLREILLRHETTAIWQTAALYHLVHAVVMLGLAAREERVGWSWRLLAIGVTVFSGSLYVLALTNVKVLGALTPLGGLCLLASWLILAIKGRSASA